VAALAAAAAGGCASMQPTGSYPGAALARPHRIVVVELPMLKDETRLHEQFAPKLPADSAESRQAIDDAVREAEARALVAMRSALARQPGITVADGESTSGGNELLRFRITDYGTTPKAWRSGYIAFEVTSTLAIAAIAYSYPATRAIAGVYLVEEGIEETVEGYAGFWALDEMTRPVRVEAELFSLETGAALWKDGATGFSDVVPGRLVRKVNAVEQDAQRARSIDEAAGKIAADVVQELAREDTAGARGRSRTGTPRGWGF
jgi:hypothetical protein